MLEVHLGRGTQHVGSNVCQNRNKDLVYLLKQGQRVSQQSQDVVGKVYKYTNFIFFCFSSSVSSQLFLLTEACQVCLSSLCLFVFKKSRTVRIGLHDLGEFPMQVVASYRDFLLA